MSPAKDMLSSEAWKRSFNYFVSYIRQGRVDGSRFDEEWYLPNDLLRKVDLMTMYHSLEARVPLVDREVIKASRRVIEPRNDAELKSSLKRLLARYLPESLVYREKSGFGLHLPVFLRSERFAKDFEASILYLKDRGLLPLRIKGVKECLERYPNLAWAVVVLAKVIKNNESI